MRAADRQPLARVPIKLKLLPLDRGAEPYWENFQIDVTVRRGAPTTLVMPVPSGPLVLPLEGQGTGEHEREDLPEVPLALQPRADGAGRRPLRSSAAFR